MSLNDDPDVLQNAREALANCKAAAKKYDETRPVTLEEFSREYIIIRGKAILREKVFEVQAEAFLQSRKIKGYA